MLQYNITSGGIRNNMLLSFLQSKGLKTILDCKVGDTIIVPNKVTVRNVVGNRNTSLQTGDSFIVDKINISNDMLILADGTYINYSEIIFPCEGVHDIRYAHIDNKGNIYNFYEKWYKNGRPMLNDIPETAMLGLVNNDLFNGKVKIKKIKEESYLNNFLFTQRRKHGDRIINKDGQLMFLNGDLHATGDAIYISRDNHNESGFTIPFDELYEKVVAKKLFDKGDDIKMVRYDKGTGLIYGNIYKTVKTIKNSGLLLIVVTDGSRNYTSNIKNFRLHEKKSE